MAETQRPVCDRAHRIVANLGWIPGVPAWDPSFTVLTMVSAIAAEMGVRTEVDDEVPELKSDVAPEAVLDDTRGDGDRAETKPTGAG